VAWSPDGDLLAISTFNFTEDPHAPEGVVAHGSLAMVDRSGEEVAFLPDEEEWVQFLSIAFTPDGEQLIGSRSPGASWLEYFGQVVVWDWTGRQLEHRIDTGGDDAVLSPRADLVVSTPRNVVETGSQVAEVWDWATGRHLRSLSHSGSVTHTAFSPDGSRLATASQDGTVRIWNPYTDAPEQLVLRGHTGGVGAVAWSPDGTRLASGGDDTLRVWALDLDELVEIAEDELTRTLTDDECGQYLHRQRCD
jgi:WD40 repeat protein